ncbi:MAG TPA: hypothetical protein VGS62_04300 [Streptosporangiaceae bacterium]|nr:hypothetical protein [Streptosporangiaceae bacterium]
MVRTRLRPPARSDIRQADGLLAGLRQAGQLRPVLIFAASAVAAGVVASFLPLAAGVSGNVVAGGLLVQALAQPPQVGEKKSTRPSAPAA